LHEFGRDFVIGRKQHLERCAVFDLGVKLAATAECKFGLMACVASECGCDGVHRGGEVGGDSNIDFGSVSGKVNQHCQ
jgi:hypothetical protein